MERFRSSLQCGEKKHKKQKAENNSKYSKQRPGNGKEQLRKERGGNQHFNKN